ncbi:Ig-like domain-containing alpha-2-macroglobulin family protein [Chondromyces apiculatus]|uniref:Large extracellular alpha-helical protein n=1 Tax=Chondromyces apiculatus DSM 436 TaxID=1192034 RepID=A0A017T7T2_9BACT|nr:Ig-like domain-containing alpha-2-macroglobulin family protein [Chondromyces apiculatus]EYF05299.1 Large extracellular alpha-helical protein [Chondromyces apiculatus DSM 436]
MRFGLRAPALRAAPLGLVVLSFGLACVQGARAPQVPTRGTLAPGGEALAAAPTGPVKVVFATPNGATQESAEISLVFDRPMRPLDLAGAEAAAPVTLTPAVPGRWMWVGTSAVSFVPDQGLPRATEMRVEVPAGTKALDGTALAEPFVIRFSTARPRLVSTEPYEGAELQRDAKFELRFNQPIADAAIQKHVGLFVGGVGGVGGAGGKETRVPFTLRRPDKDNAMLAEITPEAPLPLDSQIVLTVDKELRGTEGPLVAGKALRHTFHTYGPLRVEKVDCDDDTPHERCAADGGLSLDFSNRVRFGDAKQAITVDSGVKIRWPDWYNDDDFVRSLQVYGRFVPGSTVRLKVAAGLKDEFGQALGAAFTREMRFDDRWPEAQIGVVGSVFEPGTAREVPIVSMNVKSLEVATGALTEEAILALEADENAPGRSPRMAEIAALPGGKRVEVKPAAAVNKPATHPVRTEEVLGGKDRRGPLAIGITYASRPGRGAAQLESDVKILQVTDLGVSAKVSPYGTLVWVTRLSDAAPVPSAEVSIRRPGAPPATVRTDAAGFATIAASAWTPEPQRAERSVLFVRAGNDWMYQRVDDMLNGWRYGGPSYDFGSDRPLGIVFSDRGIYRPGDTVKVKGIFREEAGRGTRTPAGKRVRFSLESPEGEALLTQEVALNAFGTFSLDAKIPATGQLGTYSLNAKVDGDPVSYNQTSATVEVAEYRPVEIKATVEPDRPSYVRGDKATFVARGDYLFGAPMSGADARLGVTRAEASFTPPGLDGFVVDEGAFTADLADRAPRGSEVESARAKLDTRGETKLTASLALPGQRGTESVTCEAEVTDVSRQSVASSTTALVHPAEFYVALKEGPLFVKAGDTVQPEILAVSPEGKRVDRVPVKVELVQRTWTVARQVSGGGYRGVYAPVDKVVGSCRVTTAQATQGCGLTVPAAGYFLVHATAVDRRGNPVGTAAPLYATGEGAVGWGDSDRLRVELQPDRESYEVGQTARVLVKSPFASVDALVTVERAGVYTRERVTLKGAAPVLSIPITEDMRPNAFVSVLLLRGRTGAAADPKGTGVKGKSAGASKGGKGGVDVRDVGGPTFRLGYAQLEVSPASRRLDVAVRPDKPEYRPGAPIAVDVQVRDAAGKPARAEVTLYAVDEGVLSLIGYEVPDPLEVFASPRRLKVGTLESRRGMGRVRNPFTDLGEDKGLYGGAGAGPGLGVRRDFRPSAYYNPSLVTDAQGKARVTFTLPDSLTTYRIMAVVAGEDDRFGYEEERVVTSRPLMARPALPRFLRAGDRMAAGVVLTSKGLPRTEVEVTLAVEGLTLRGEAKQRLTLEPGVSREVPFALEASSVGTAKLRFQVRGGGADDAVEVTRDVKAPVSPEAVALYGDTTTASAEKLGDLSALRPDVGGLAVSLSSTALVGLESGMEQLLEYPYGCTEQLVSRLVPLLPLGELARDFRLELPKNVDALASKTVAAIVANQRGDGGFGLWADSPLPNDWVTAYAMWGLGEAKRHKVAVPASVMELGTHALRRALEQPLQGEYAQRRLAVVPFMLDVLAGLGAPDPGRASRAFEERAEMPLFSKALLLHALVLGKGDKAQIDALVTELEGAIRIDGAVARAVVNTGSAYAPLMDSEVRTSALVLRGLLAARPSHALGARLAAGLLAARKGGTWRSTQEAAWSLLALDQYRKAQEKTAPDFDARVFLGEAEIFSAPFHGRDVRQARVSIPASQLTRAGGAPLAFSADGEGRLFYQARLRYARKELPTKPLERGFFVQKTLRAVLPEELPRALAGAAQGSARQFKGGDLVLGEVVVVTPSPRDFVVIDDPLPAGFEAVDARLATTAGSLDVDRVEMMAEEDTDEEEGDEEDARAMRKRFGRNEFIREIRDDRVLFFVDHLPAGMYRYRYLARATTLGRFVLPPTRAEEMYQPEVLGRTAAEGIEIVPQDARGGAPDVRTSPQAAPAAPR